MGSVARNMYIAGDDVCEFIYSWEQKHLLRNLLVRRVIALLLRDQRKTVRLVFRSFGRYELFDLYDAFSGGWRDLPAAHEE